MSIDLILSSSLLVNLVIIFHFQRVKCIGIILKVSLRDTNEQPAKNKTVAYLYYMVLLELDNISWEHGIIHHSTSHCGWHSRIAKVANKQEIHSFHHRFEGSQQNQ